MKKKEAGITALVVAATIVIVFMCVLMWQSLSNSHKYTDGVVTAVFDKEAGTLIFSGNGTVAWVSQWVKLNEEERSSVHTVIFEDGITGIESYEFCTPDPYRDFSRVKKVIFEGNIDMIGQYVFYDNLFLTTIVFRGGCQRIGFGAFGECPLLATYAIPEGCQVEPTAFELQS